MRPFLIENPTRVFEPREPNSEKEFEDQVIRVAGDLMPNFETARWKPLIRDWRGRGARPDLAMVSHDLESWYVVEVELASHSIRGHIAPQLETLGNGVYDSSLVRSLRRSFPSQDVSDLTRMVGRDPGLLCIANEYTDRIWRTCRDTGFELVVLEPYVGIMGGAGVLVERLPSEFSREIAPSTYVLRRSHKLGNSTVLTLPRNFPASFYKIRVSSEPDADEYPIQRFSDSLGVVLPLDLIPDHVTAKIEIVGPSKRIAQLVLEEP